MVAPLASVTVHLTPLAITAASAPAASLLERHAVGADDHCKKDDEPPPPTPLSCTVVDVVGVRVPKQDDPNAKRPSACYASSCEREVFSPPVAGGDRLTSLLAGAAVLVLGAVLLLLAARIVKEQDTPHSSVMIQAASVLLVAVLCVVLAAVLFRKSSTCIAPSRFLPFQEAAPPSPLVDRRLSLYYHLAFVVVLLAVPGAQGQGFRIAEEGQGLDLPESLRHRALTDGTFQQRSKLTAGHRLHL